MALSLEPGLVVAVLAAVTYALILSYLSIQRHVTYNSTAYDLAIFDQAIWNTAHGRWFEGSMKDVHNPSLSLMGDHFSPVLALLAPVYLVWEDVRALLIVQSFYVGLGAIPAYLLARTRLKSSLASGILAAAYLAMPPMARVNLFDYHTDTLLVPLLPAAIYFVYTGRRYAFLASVVALLLIKEEVAFTVAALGLYAAFFPRWRLIGLATTGLSVAWYFATINLIIPYFKGGPYEYFDRYGHLGEGMVGIVVNLITNPGMALSLALQPDGLAYLAAILAILAGLPLLGPLEWVVALPVLAGNLLTDYELQRMLGYHYALPVVIAAYAASVRGLSLLARLLERIPSVARVAPALTIGVAVLVLGASVRSNLEMGPLPNMAELPNRTELAEVVSLIPPDASLATTNSYGSHFAHRRVLVVLPRPELSYSELPAVAEYVLINRHDLRWWGMEGMTWWGIDDARLDLRQAVSPEMYHLIYNRNGVQLYQSRWR